MPYGLVSCTNVTTVNTRSLGDRHGARSCVCTPEVSVVSIAPHEFARFIIGSDGLWGVTSNEAAMQLSLSQGDPKQAANALATDAQRLREATRAPRDDITCIVLDVNPGANPLVVQAQCGCTVT